MFPLIIFKRLYLLYTRFFKEKKLHQINECFIIFPTSTIVLYKKRRKIDYFLWGFVHTGKKHTKCSCYSLIMFFLLNQVLIYDVENQPNRHVIIGILLGILHQEKLGERIAQHCNTWCHLIARLFFYLFNYKSINYYY